MERSFKNKERGQRLGWLDFGKAAGILVVLLVHAECRLGPLTFYGGMFYMPVFFVAAGYTYRCQKEQPFWQFLKRKAVRLLVPYGGSSAFLWLFFWLKDSLLRGNPADWKLSSLFGILYSRNQMYTSAFSGENPVLLDLLNAPLWFLTAIFLTYVWYEFISRSGRKYVLLGLGLLFSVIWHQATPLLLPWSLDAVPYFACFFAAGEWLREWKKEELLGEVWFLALLLVSFLLSSRLNKSVNLSCGDYGQSMLLGLVPGITGSLLVFAAGMCLEKKCPPVMKAISKAGQETMTVLCFHMFVFMFIRTGATVLGFREGITKAVLVLGSLVLLTGGGILIRRLRGRACSGADDRKEG